MRCWRNLTGVPSFHFDAVFGRVVHEIFARAPPQAVALELPPEMASELAWAAACWPAAVVSLATTRGRRAAATTLPFVPGDSILEAFRLATRHGLPIAFVDRHVRTTAKERAARRHWLPGAELAGRTGRDYAAVADALMKQEPAGRSDLAREAVMARHLAALMEQYESVLWVGGLAHWCRIEARLGSGDFSSPRARPGPTLRWRRARLAPSALQRMTGQSPWRVHAFADAPLAFDPLEAVRRLLHGAGKEATRDPGTMPEPCSAIDRARTGIYARNLAATGAMGEEPDISHLLLAARDTIGPRYAARVYRLGMAEQLTSATASLDPLTFENDRDRHVAGYRFRGRWVSLMPWHPVDRAILTIPDLADVERSERDGDYAGLPSSRPGEKHFWGAYPPDQADYEAFVEYVLRRASIRIPERPASCRSPMDSPTASMFARRSASGTKTGSTCAKSGAAS
ncbi:MAG: hypothetical protein H0W08_21655 [Acidobacteria bacterium]|nr:hypothetical protein [Acidobacteriota bacterium]